MENNTVLAIGRLVPVKNFNVLVDAWKYIDVPLGIVGDGPQKKRLEKQINQLELHPRVQLYGFRKDVFTLLNDADIVINVSQREGFGYSILEALQAQCVVISTRVGIAADVITPDYLIQPTVESIRERVHQVLADLPKVKSAFRPLWERMKQQTVSRMVDETYHVYRAI